MEVPYVLVLLPNNLDSLNKIADLIANKQITKEFIKVKELNTNRAKTGSSLDKDLRTLLNIIYVAGSRAQKKLVFTETVDTKKTSSSRYFFELLEHLCEDLESEIKEDKEQDLIALIETLKNF